MVPSVQDLDVFHQVNALPILTTPLVTDKGAALYTTGIAKASAIFAI